MHFFFRASNKDRKIIKNASRSSKEWLVCEFENFITIFISIFVANKINFEKLIKYIYNFD